MICGELDLSRDLDLLRDLDQLYWGVGDLLLQLAVGDLLRRGVGDLLRDRDLLFNREPG